jgi:hypothetical protein
MLEGDVGLESDGDVSLLGLPAPLTTETLITDRRIGGSCRKDFRSNQKWDTIFSGIQRTIFRKQHHTLCKL